MNCRTIRSVYLPPRECNWLHFCVMWMNSFPVKSGISEKWSPRELVSRTKLDAKLHCRAPFGSYCEMHIDPDITNTLEPRTNWAICMGPTGNLQGSYKFLSLATGKKVTRRKFTEMPVTDAVMKQVEEMAVKDGAIKGINFKDRKGLDLVLLWSTCRAALIWEWGLPNFSGDFLKLYSPR